MARRKQWETGIDEIPRESGPHRQETRPLATGDDWAFRRASRFPPIPNASQLAKRRVCMETRGFQSAKSNTTKIKAKMIAIKINRITTG